MHVWRGEGANPVIFRIELKLLNLTQSAGTKAQLFYIPLFYECAEQESQTLSEGREKAEKKRVRVWEVCNSTAIKRES